MIENINKIKIYLIFLFLFFTHLSHGSREKRTDLTNTNEYVINYDTTNLFFKTTISAFPLEFDHRSYILQGFGLRYRLLKGVDRIRLDINHDSTLSVYNSSVFSFIDLDEDDEGLINPIIAKVPYTIIAPDSICVNLCHVLLHDNILYETTYDLIKSADEFKKSTFKDVNIFSDGIQIHMNKFYTYSPKLNNVEIMQMSGYMPLIQVMELTKPIYKDKNRIKRKLDYLQHVNYINTKNNPYRISNDSIAISWSLDSRKPRINVIIDSSLSLFYKDICIGVINKWNDALYDLFQSDIFKISSINDLSENNIIIAYDLLDTEICTTMKVAKQNGNISFATINIGANFFHNRLDSIKLYESLNKRIISPLKNDNDIYIRSYLTNKLMNSFRYLLGLNYLNENPEIINNVDHLLLGYIYNVKMESDCRLNEEIKILRNHYLDNDLVLLNNIQSLLSLINDDSILTKEEKNKWTQLLIQTNYQFLQKYYIGNISTLPKRKGVIKHIFHNYNLFFNNIINQDLSDLDQLNQIKSLFDPIFDIKFLQNLTKIQCDNNREFNIRDYFDEYYNLLEINCNTVNYLAHIYVLNISEELLTDLKQNTSNNTLMTYSLIQELEKFHRRVSDMLQKAIGEPINKKTAIISDYLKSLMK